MTSHEMELQKEILEIKIKLKLRISFPDDASRVLLKCFNEDPDSDYINASFINVCAMLFFYIDKTTNVHINILLSIERK